MIKQIQKRKFNVLDVLILLFAGNVYLSTVAFNRAPLNVTKLRMFTLLIVLYFVFRLIFRIFSKKQRNTHTVFCLMLIVSGLIESITGLRQLYGFSTSQHALFNLTGSFFNPGPYAGFLAVVFPISLCWFLNRQYPKFIKYISAVTCIAIILVLPAAMSRASWLAVIAGSFAVVYGKWNANYANLREWKSKICANSRNLRSIICITVFVLACAALAGMYFLKKNSADGRMFIWKISLQTLVHHPLGAGLGNFSGAYGNTQAAWFASGQASETEELVAGNPEYGFNEYLQIGVESGVMALLLFIGILVLALGRLWRNKDWGALGSLVSLSVFAWFSYPFSVGPFLTVLVFLLAVSQMDRTLIAQIYADKSFKFALICVICVPVFCLYQQFPVYKAHKKWNENRFYYHSGMYEEAISKYEPLYPHLNDRVEFLFEYAQCLSKSNRPEKSNHVLQRAAQISCDPMLYNILGKNYQAMKQYGQAEAAFIHAAQLVPSRLYPWYLLTKLYGEMGLQDKTCETAKIVLTKEPKVQSPAVREMREEIKKILLYLQ